MSLRFLVGVMFVIGLAASAYISLIVPGNEVTPARLGAVAGGAIGLLALPLLIAGPWKLIQRRSGNLTNAPQLTAGVLFALMAVGAINGAKVEDGGASSDIGTVFIFMPDGGCAYSVEFPGAPEIKDNHVAGGIVAKEANLYLTDAFMRAECLATGGRFPVTEPAAKAQLVQFAEKQGLTDVTVSTEIVSGHVRGHARGVKMAAGKWATYEIRMIVGPQSIMSAVAGGVSSGFPQPGISPFLDSIRPLAN